MNLNRIDMIKYRYPQAQRIFSLLILQSNFATTQDLLIEKATDCSSKSC